jgi:hypothetical protein
MIVRVILAVLFFVAASFPRTASADQTLESPRWSLTFSPAHLVIWSMQATLERRVTDRFSIAGFGALGSALPGLSVQELGFQTRWYIRHRDWWNPHVGIETFWAHVQTSFSTVDADSDRDFPDDEEGERITFFGTGPFIGIKLMGPGRMVTDIQAGLQPMGAYGDYHFEKSRFEMGLLPILNLNFGWSF